MQFTPEEIAAGTNGTLIGRSRAFVSHVTIDSRTVQNGSLFVALRGQKEDGHRFVKSISHRVRAAMVDHPLDLPVCQIRVEDTRKGLWDLARLATQKFGGRFVAITGSVGKTTTKELLYSLVSKFYPAAATPGNLNSTTGFPISLCNLPEASSVAVLEMGMNAPGELDLMGSIAPPDILVYTAIKPVHMEFFGSLEEVAKAKGELLNHLKPGGTLVYDTQDPYLKHIASRWSGRSVTYGLDEADIKGHILEDRGFEGFDMTLSLSDRQFLVEKIPGHLHPGAVLASLAVGCILDLSPERLMIPITRFDPVSHRGEIHHLSNGITLVDDSYNASPSAVMAALAKLKRTRSAARRVFIFGDMLELGSMGEAEHRKIGVEAASCIDCLITVGPLAQLAGECFQKTGKPYYASSSPSEAAERASAISREGDWVLIKGSRSVNLDLTVQFLKEAA